MKLDTRNPFADWGFEEEKYAVNISQKDYTYTKYATGATISAGTVYYTYSSETGIYTEATANVDITVTEVDNYYSRSNTTTTGINKLETKGFINETVVDNAYNEVAKPITAAKYAEQHSGRVSFFTNNENMLPSALETKAYGDNKDLQREYPAGESLNYYGNEADDLHLYGDPKNTESGDEETTNNNDDLSNGNGNGSDNQSQTSDNTNVVSGNGNEGGGDSQPQITDNTETSGTTNGQ